MSRFFDPRLLRQARSVRHLLVLTVGLGALGGAATVAQAFALSRAVDGVFLGGLGLTGVRTWLLWLAGLAAVRALFIWAGDVAANRVALRVKTDLRTRLMAHILALGPAFTSGERTGELVNTAVEGVEALDAYFSQYLPQVVLAAIVPLTFLAFVFPNDPLSGLVLLLTAPLIPLFMILIGNLADALTRRQWTALSRMSAHFLDVLQGLTTLKLFNRSREQIAVIRQITDRHRDATLNVLRVAFLSALVLEMVGTLSTAIVAVEIGLRLLYGKMAFQQAFFVLVLAPEFYLPLRLLGTRFHAGIAGVTAARRIFEVLEAPAGEQRSTGAEECFARSRGAEELLPPHLRTSAPPHLQTSTPPLLRFEDVHYVYAGREIPALNGVSFEIHPGEKLALVGSSGAGKSTVARLLLGFIAPTAGQVTVVTDGGEFPRSPSEQSGCQLPAVAWVPQLPYLFNTTVVENMRLGRSSASRDEGVVAAQQAGADDFIRALPQGYDTIIGERGARLSGGQAQRIALARAFLVDAPLVILDEATANLDPESETLIQASLARLLIGRSALIIAHRLNTVRSADRIVVLDRGRVAETGTHDELMARDGLYRRLVEAGGAETEERRSRGAEERRSRGAEERRSRGAEERRSRGAEERIREGVGEREGTGAARSSAKPPCRVRPAARGGTQHAAARSLPVGRSTLYRLLSFLAPFWPWIALSVLLGFVTIGSSIGLMATAAWIIATAALHPSIAVLQVAIVGVRFFGIARGVFRYLERLTSHAVTFRVLARLRVWFYSALEPLAPARLMQHRSGDLLSRVVADIGTLENFYIRAIAPPLVALSVAGLMWIFLGSFDRRLAFAVVGLMLAAGVGVPSFLQMLSRRPAHRLLEQRAALNACLVDGIQGAADLVAFGATGAEVAQVRTLGAGLGRAQRQLAVLSGLGSALGSLLTGLAVVAVLALAIPLVTAGQIAGVYLGVLALATAASFEAVLPLPLAAQYLESSLVAARRLFVVADAGGFVSSSVEEGEIGGTGATEMPCAPTRPLPIEVSGLTLRYAPDEPLALDDVTFSVPAGACVAVVGPSGAGKSTLANALLRFWDYEAGEVRLDGHELRDLTPEEVRRQIGVVTQSTHLFNATVRDNLRLARPGVTQAEIEAAACAAHIHEFIAALPAGYDTWIGEQGLRLSGGERQRLAIARALLQDAPVLILDEPTAHLDAATERALLSDMSPLFAGRTTLIITHRLVGLERADEILVFDQGRIVERGRHAALLRRGGVYRQMWEVCQQQL